MLQPGPALKVTVHLNEDSSNQEGFLHTEILSFLQQHGIQGATVFRPYAGYGTTRQLHTSGSAHVAGEHLPVLIVFVDTEEKIRPLLPELLGMAIDGLVEAHPVEILKNVASPEGVIR